MSEPAQTPSSLSYEPMKRDSCSVTGTAAGGGDVGDSGVCMADRVPVPARPALWLVPHPRGTHRLRPLLARREIVHCVFTRLHNCGVATPRHLLGCWRGCGTVCFVRGVAWSTGPICDSARATPVAVAGWRRAKGAPAMRTAAHGAHAATARSRAHFSPLSLSRAVASFGFAAHANAAAADGVQSLRLTAWHVRCAAGHGRLSTTTCVLPRHACACLADCACPLRVPGTGAARHVRRCGVSRVCGAL